MKPLRIALWISFGIFLSLFIEGLLSDWFYSNCVNIGSNALSCLNRANGLQPLVISGNYWYLTPFMNAFGQLHSYAGMQPYVAFSDTMGIVAGIGFIGSLTSWFLLHVQKGKQIALIDSMILSGTLYVFSFVGFLVFLPFCVVYQCRVTNYLPWLSYDNALVGAAVVLSFGMLGRIYLLIMKGRNVKQQEKEINNQT